MFNPALNGGFPEPPVGEPQRLVRARHDDCGADTRVRLPRVVPARAVRRVVCERCAAPYAAGQVEELGVVDSVAAPVPAAPAPVAPAPAPVPAAPVPVAPAPAPAPAAATDGGGTAEPAVAAPAPSRPGLPHIGLPSIHSRAWRWGSIAVAAAAVVAILLLIQRGSDESTTPTGAGAEAEGQGGQLAVPTQARFVTEPGFSLALPPGWEQVQAKGGAAFAARAVDGTADATLWIERDPKLSFQEFEARSAEQLRSLSGSDPEVVERIPAPTIDGTVVRLRADAPAESGVSSPFDVTLRATGPYRYYLATTVLPGASREASDGADLIHGSFVPEAAGGDGVVTGTTPGSGGSNEGNLP